MYSGKEEILYKTNNLLRLTIFELLRGPTDISIPRYILRNKFRREKRKRPNSELFSILIPYRQFIIILCTIRVKCKIINYIYRAYSCSSFERLFCSPPASCGRKSKYCPPVIITNVYIHIIIPTIIYSA